MKSHVVTHHSLISRWPSPKKISKDIQEDLLVPRGPESRGMHHHKPQIHFIFITTLPIGNTNTMSLNKQTVNDVDFTDKRVLMRVDFNVPQDKEGNITNTQRIVGAMPTIELVLSKGAKSVVLMSHLGRPDGMKNPKFTLKPVADKLGELMNKPITFLSDCVGEVVEKACADPEHGSIIVLENMRFYAEEEGKGKNAEGEKFKPSPEDVTKFRNSLAKLGDVYVCDAFGTAHRAHSSMVGMAGKIPCVSGLLVAKELEAFSKVLNPELKKTPLTSIVGGAKISDKVLVIDNLIDQSDNIIICGGMAYTFLKTCFGMDIGKSLFGECNVAIFHESN